HPTCVNSRPPGCIHRAVIVANPNTSLHKSRTILSALLGLLGPRASLAYYRSIPATLSMSTATLSAAEGATPSSVAVKHKIVFVLGGPGSGKGTQCLRLIEEFPDVAHFSAGDLLRDHIKSGTPDGNMVADMIKNGQIVPAQITIGLLQRAMASSGKQRILIDGFPRNQDNRDTFLSMVGYDCSLVLFFDCPEAVLEKRLLARNQGRTDDNIESIKKRFQVFVQQSMPIVESYEKQGKVARINTDRPIDDIYLEVRRLIMELGQGQGTGAATALQPQFVAQRVAEEVVLTLSSAVKRDWHRVGRDIRGLEAVRSLGSPRLGSCVRLVGAEGERGLCLGAGGPRGVCCVVRGSLGSARWRGC
ncbi:uncharacterized protein HaLaN_09619, partial [Haematococcus lacustris]